MPEAEYKKVPIDEIEKKISTGNEEQVKYGYGVRHVQAFIYFLCLVFGYASRGHLGVTIVAMTIAKPDPVKSIAIADVLTNDTLLYTINTTTESDKNYSIIDDLNFNVSLENNLTNMDQEIIHETYDWSKSIQEMVLGAFFLGYSIMMFPIGLICQRWGGKIPLQISMFVSGIVSFLTPWLISWGGWKTLCALRVIIGLSQSGLYPGIQTLVSSWVPKNERASISSYVFTAPAVGTVIAFQSAGVLANSRFGWPSTFVASGVVCTIGFVLITFFGAATPADHKYISEAEKLYITGKINDGVKRKKTVPWKSVLKSVPVWAAIALHAGVALNFLFFFVEVPTYMYAVLKFNIKTSGMLSSIPYIASFFASIAFGFLSDFLTNRNIVTIKTARKIFGSIGSIIPAICLAAVAYTTNTVLAVALFIIFASGIHAMNVSWVVNYTDLSPNFSGALMATGNTVANGLMLAMPAMVSYIITDVTNQYQWRITLFVMAGFIFISNAIFFTFMSADVQPWNDGSDVKDEKELEALKLGSNGTLNKFKEDNKVY